MRERGSQPIRLDRFFVAIVLLALILRTYHFGYPFWDYFASRQTFNLMVVKGYVDHGISLFRPGLDWLVTADTSRPSYFCAEFPWLHALAAMEMRALSFGDWCTRLIPVALSIAGLWWIYSLTRRAINWRAARFAALTWAVLPFSVFFGRAFMSDMPALSLAVGSLDAFCAWLETRRLRHLLAFALLGSLAALTKPQAATFGLVAAYLGFLEFRWRLLAQWRLYAAAAVMALPAGLWIHHTGVLFKAGGPPVIGTGMLGRSLHLWLQASAWAGQWDRMSHSVLGPVGLVLALVGFAWPSGNPRHYLFHVWLLGSALFLFLIPEAIIGWNDYYLLLLVPPSAGLIGIALGNLHGHKTTRTASLLISMALVTTSILIARSLYRSDELHYHLGVLLNRLTRPNDLIVTSAGGAPDPLYFSKRRGWEANTYDLSRLEELSAAGGVLFAMADPEVIRHNSGLVPLLDRRFVRLTQDDLAGPRGDWMIWSLGPFDLHPNPSESQSAGAVSAVDFGGKIVLKAISIREVLDWPASFEVKYYWQCARSPGADLRVFVHVTTPEGQVVFRQDHWPKGGRLRTSQWNGGEAIAERYVLVLPGEVTPGRYQLRIGWFDPSGGPRLPIVRGASDGEDRAIVGELIVRAKPSSGWFRIAH